MPLLPAIILAIIIVCVFRLIGSIISYFELWDALFYALMVLLATVVILILTASASFIEAT